MDYLKMDGQTIHIMNTNEVEGLADPSLQQYEYSLYNEKDERDVIQKKTFTKWVNKHLIKDHKGIEDLFEDLRDGRNLLTLLEVLSGEHLSREKGTMRVHMLQNVQIALNFLKNQRIKLVNIRPEDIVDGNPKLTLGLIWTIILHFQISDIIQHEENELPKEVLLKWAQLTTDSYPNVYVRDFTNSWKSGLAFLAIIHRNVPESINFRERLNRPARENLELAFNIYEKDFNICRLLDPEDVDTSKPDEKSLITYISSIYELFKEPNPFNPFKDVDLNAKLNEYNQHANNLTKWIKDKTNKLNDLTWRNQAYVISKLNDDLQEFYENEVPLRLEEKSKLKELHKELVKLSLDNEIVNELNQNTIDLLWNQMMKAFNLRKEAIDENLQRALKIAKKIVDESAICHLNLEQISNLIDEQSERIKDLCKEDNETNFEKIKQNLNDEFERIEFLNKNLTFNI